MSLYHPTEIRFCLVVMFCCLLLVGQVELALHLFFVQLYDIPNGLNYLLISA